VVSSVTFSGTQGNNYFFFKYVVLTTENSDVYVGICCDIIPFTFLGATEKFRKVIISFVKSVCNVCLSVGMEQLHSRCMLTSG